MAARHPEHPQRGPSHTHDHTHDHDHDHDHDHAPASPPAGAMPPAEDCCTAGACRSTAVPIGASPASAARTAAPGELLLRIPAMDCPVEEGEIRRVLDGFGDIRSLHFDLPARTLGIEAPAARWDTLDQAIQAAGFETERIAAAPSAEATARSQRRELGRLVAALVVALIAELTHFFAPEALAWELLGMGIAAGAIALAGTSVFRKGWSALRRGHLNINALMTVAVSGAFLIGQWPEAAMVMALYSLAELIEARSVERARHAIAGLLALSPPQAEVRQADGAWLLVDAQAVAVGATVRIKPGERFALDGRVLAGQSAVDQSPITGESLPVDKGPGDEVFAGTINQHGELSYETSKPAGDTVLARIIHAVEQAQSQRAPTQRFVDRFAAVYTPAVFAVALAVALLGPLLAGWPWLTALYKALVLLVIACPCALVISTPVTVVSGLAAAARRGILIKGGVYLEEARRLRAVALDKTGTVTEGRPRLVAHERVSSALPAERVLAIARSLAARSDHPVSQALAAGLQAETVAIEGFVAQAGRGVSGQVDGQAYVLGNHRWVEERGQCSPELEARLREHEQQGRTLSLLAGEQGVLALFAVADSTKATSREAIAQLQALGIRTVMLTGDNPATAQAIAQEVGLTEVRANLLPQDKLQAIEALRAQGAVGMVGDGINDGPALSAASIGFGMGGAGSDTAMEAADVIIMNDDLRKLPETIRLSRRTHAVLWQNIALALGIKLVFLLLALFDSATMWMAVFADMGASLLVVFNGLRLLRAKAQ